MITLSEWVFRRDLKEATELACLRSLGREFHSCGAQTAKALSPFVMRQDLGTIRKAVPADIRQRSGS